MRGSILSIVVIVLVLSHSIFASNTSVQNATNSSQTTLNDIFDNAQKVGDVIFVEDELGSSAVYVEIGDSEPETTFTTNFSQIIRINDSALKQNLTITNTLDIQQEIIINLWNYPEDINTDFLASIDKFDIIQNNESISETPIFFVTINASESITLNINYFIESIIPQYSCKTINIKDLIPSDATIISSEIPLETIVKKECTVTIQYDGVSTTYDAWELIPELEGHEITKVMSSGIELEKLDNRTFSLQ